MNNHVQEKGARGIFCFPALLSVLSILLFFVVLALVGFQIYVRWFKNQDFIFVGGNELEVLTASAFAFLSVIAYIHRPERGAEK